ISACAVLETSPSFCGLDPRVGIPTNERQCAGKWFSADAFYRLSSQLAIIAAYASAKVRDFCGVFLMLRKRPDRSADLVA
ncbi:MAG: hypothetical protein AB7T14_01340, partial [Candidatus Methylacidiphilaceae bacterium]